MTCYNQIAACYTGVASDIDIDIDIDSCLALTHPPRRLLLEPYQKTKTSV